MRRRHSLEWVAIILVILGAINWGLIGLFGVNLFDAIFGSVPDLPKLVYIIVGLAGIYMLFITSRFRRT